MKGKKTCIETKKKNHLGNFFPKIGENIIYFLILGMGPKIDRKKHCTGRLRTVLVSASLKCNSVVIDICRAKDKTCYIRAHTCTCIR